ncbi:N-acetyltransferase [Staphylococcus croceilyticus]|uniref:N-acetyltransferase n=1 Tax=Staphylococcus croceilyticus TaxID=319942 RepID=A0ABY2KA53_9STAP|nr:N-acetyltransferase [Staphylococcus croceilyticus]PNZ68340.1 GNAT family N-acetyltransferase [Staphylococcus croceilyticus]TGA71292.1 N-acetyltransferase [Staphylococcus croceilyticus]
MQIYLSTLTETDYAATLDKIEESYNQHANQNGASQRQLVARLRQAETYNYELEVIAKNENGEIIGHIMLSEVNLVTDDNKYKALELVSLIVDERIHNQGLGKALVQAIEERAKSQHYTTIIVGCSPDYFEKIGYERADVHHIFSKETNEDKLRVKFLWDQLNDYPHGTVRNADII